MSKIVYLVPSNTIKEKLFSILYLLETDTNLTKDVLKNHFDKINSELGLRLSDEILNDILNDPMNITFLTFEDLVSVERNLDLLRIIRETKPQSIRELSRILQKDFKHVYWRLYKLHMIGLIDLKRIGNRQVPTVPYDELEVKTSLIWRLS